MKKIIGKYNFNPINNSFKTYSYKDDDNIIILHIFKSGWKGYYHCVVENPQYEESYLNTYTSTQISQKYGIKKFLRIDKLKKIYDSNL